MVKTRSSTRPPPPPTPVDNPEVIQLEEDDEEEEDENSTKNSRKNFFSSSSSKKSLSKDKPTTTTQPKQSKKRKHGSFDKKQKNGKKNSSKNVNGTILAYFKAKPPPPDESSSCSDSNSSSFSDEDGDDSPAEKEPKKKIKIDPKTRLFLESGVPEVVSKAQKFVEKRKIQDDYLSMMDFFPKIQHTVPPEQEGVIELIQVKIKIKNNDDDMDDEPIITPLLPLVANSESTTSPLEPICCRLNNLSLVSDEELGISNANPVPWIEDCKIEVDGLKELCCDKEALSTLTVWLKQWKTDIKDDGGASRKIDVKKSKDKDDFITSDEEEEDVKKKSVLLIGPPGSGKTCAVYAAAKHYGFHVVEVNFSSRRAGKDVLQRVEEAVLSHRLKSGQNCLLLFEDIDLIDQKEDEGFHSAVSRLITNAVRPIVMTTSCLGELSLDPKLEKKSPLLIQFPLPNSSQIVRKVLLPMILRRSSVIVCNENDNNDDEDNEKLQDNIKNKLSTLLDSICRHGRNDVRQIINQTQFLFTFTNDFNFVNYINTHQHSIQSNLLLDWNGFVQSSSSKDSSNNNSEEQEEDFILRRSVKSRKEICYNQLDGIAEMLSFACDMDVSISSSNISCYDHHHEDELSNSQQIIETLNCNYFDSNFCLAFSNCCSKSGVSERLAQSLIIDTDQELKNIQKGYALFNEIGEYCDNIHSDGGWESASYVRSIIKRNLLDSAGRLAKRNGRVTSYFNRLDRAFTNRICESFGYDKELSLKSKDSLYC